MGALKTDSVSNLYKIEFLKRKHINKDTHLLFIAESYGIWISIVDVLPYQKDLRI